MARAAVTKERAASAPPVARVTVNLPARVWQDLAGLADRRQISKTDALRWAISLAVAVDRQQQRGRDVIFEGPDGSSRERLFFAY